MSSPTCSPKMWQYIALSACLFSVEVSADGHLEHRKWYSEGSKTVGRDMYLQYGELFESALYDDYSVKTNDTVKYLPVFQYFFRRKLQCEGAPKLWDHDTKWTQSSMNCYANKLDVGGAKRTWGKKCKWKVCMHCPQCLEPCTDQTATFKVTKRACLCVEDKTEDFFSEPLYDETGLKYVASIPRLEKTCLTSDYCNNSLNNNVDGYCYQPFAPTPAPPTPTPPTPAPPTPAPPTMAPPTPTPPTPGATPFPTMPPLPEGVCYLAAPGAHACKSGYVSPHIMQCDTWAAAFAKASGKTMGRPLQKGPHQEPNQKKEYYGGSCLDQPGQDDSIDIRHSGWGAVPGGCSVQSGLDFTAHYKFPAPGLPIEDATTAGCVSTDYQLICCMIQEFWFNQTEEYKEETGFAGIYLEQSVRRRWATYVNGTDRRRDYAYRRRTLVGTSDEVSDFKSLPFDKDMEHEEVEKIIFEGWRGGNASHGYGKEKYSERNRKDLMPGQQEKCAAIAQNLFGHELYLINDASAQPGCLLTHIIDGEEAMKYIEMDMPRSYDGFAFLVASLTSEFSGVNSRYGVVYNLIGEMDGTLYNDDNGLGMVPVCEKGTCQHWCEFNKKGWNQKCGWAACAECDHCLTAKYVMGDYNTGECPPTAWKLETGQQCKDAAEYLDIPFNGNFHRGEDTTSINKAYPAGCYMDLIDGNSLNQVIRYNPFNRLFAGPGHIRPTTKAVCQREAPYKVGDCVKVPLSGKTSSGKIIKYVKNAEWEILFDDGSHGCHEGIMLQHSTECSEEMCRDTCHTFDRPWSQLCAWPICKACDRCLVHGPPIVFKNLGEGVCVDSLERMPDMYVKFYNFDSAVDEQQRSVGMTPGSTKYKYEMENDKTIKGFYSKDEPMDYNRCEADCVKLDSCLGYSNLQFKEGAYMSSANPLTKEYGCGIYVTGYNASFRKTKDYLRLTMHLGYKADEIHASETAGLEKSKYNMNWWSHQKSPVLEINGVNGSYLPLLESQIEANANSLLMPNCMMKTIKSGKWNYATPAPPTPAPPTPPPERFCFYTTDFVTVKKDAKALDGTTWAGFHAPFHQQEEGPIRNACGRVAKRICNDDALHLKKGQTKYFREGEKYNDEDGGALYTHDGFQDHTNFAHYKSADQELKFDLPKDDMGYGYADDGYYSTSQKGSKLGFVTHRDGRYVGQEWYGQGPNYGQTNGIQSGNKPEKLGEDGNPRRRVSLWGSDRRRQPKLYGAQWGAKRYYTPDYVLVYFENGYVNSYRFRDLELCEDQACSVGDKVDAIWYCCHPEMRDGKGRCTKTYPATIAAVNGDGTFTVTWSEEANATFVKDGGSYCNPGFNWDKSYADDMHTGLIPHDDEPRRRRKPKAEEEEMEKVSDRIILGEDIYRFGREACTKPAGSYPDKHYPTLAPPTPAPPTPIPEAIMNKMAARVTYRAENKAKRTEAREAKNAKDDEKRRRDKANQCQKFCSSDKADWKTKCVWKSCLNCERCEREKVYARQYVEKKAAGCAGWCLGSAAKWNTKCGWELCGECSTCALLREDKSPRRLLLI